MTNRRTSLSPFRRLTRDSRGATAAEFALVLPLLLILMFGIIDAGRLFFDTNRAEKATQMGARFAIVTDVIPPQLVSADYVGTTYCTRPDGKPCTAGDALDLATALGTLKCTSTGCTCTGNCPGNVAISAAAFTRLTTHMVNFYPDITEANVIVTFRGSGIGFAGDPGGMDVIPLVSVELTGLEFTPITLLSLTKFNLPAFRTTLSAESAIGTLAN